LPDIVASLRNGQQGTTVSWQLRIEYKRSPRNDDELFPSPNKRQLDAAAEWAVTAEIGGIRGGTATISVDKGGNPPWVDKFVFYIRGTNPTEEAVATYIGNNPWYAKAIARHESDRPHQGRNYSQFNVTPRYARGPGWNDIGDCPNRTGGADASGWGIFQLTKPVPSADCLWNWKANVDAGKAMITSKQTMAQTYFDFVRTTYDPDHYVPLPAAAFVVPNTNNRTINHRLDVASIMLFNGGGGAPKLEDWQTVGTPPQRRLVATYRSCWEWHPEGEDDLHKWVFKDNSNGYVRLIVNEATQEELNNQ